MNLLDDFGRKCILLEKKREADGEGGYLTVWTDGAEFVNYLALDSSMQARIAEKEGVTSLYSALVSKSVPLEYGDFFRDAGNGLTYRVTSNPTEKEAPQSAGTTIRALKYFTAERKELPK